MSGLMKGKRGLVMGVANDHSIAWGIAKALHREGAQLAFTYQGEGFGRRVTPLAQSVGSDIVMNCDVTNEESVAAVFDTLADKWGSLDFLVHAIAYSDKTELKGRYVETTRANFLRTMDISCFSFTDVVRRAAPMMNEGGAFVTLSYLGAEKVMPSYNVMGVAKAALEASVRYLAEDLGWRQLRVNAISAGPMRTLAGSVIGGGRFVFAFNKRHSPLRRTVELDEVGNAGLYLLSPLSSAVTGEVHYVDSGYHVIGMPRSEDLAAGATDD